MHWLDYINPFTSKAWLLIRTDCSNGRITRFYEVVSNAAMSYREWWLVPTASEISPVIETQRIINLLVRYECVVHWKCLIVSKSKRSLRRYENMNTWIHKHLNTSIHEHLNTWIHEHLSTLTYEDKDLNEEWFVGCCHTGWFAWQLFLLKNICNQYTLNKWVKPRGEYKYRLSVLRQHSVTDWKNSIQFNQNWIDSFIWFHSYWRNQYWDLPSRIK